MVSSETTEPSRNSYGEEDKIIINGLIYLV